MFVYILQYVKVSDSYHSGGGVVVIAEHRRQAKELLSEIHGMEVTEEDWNSVEFYLLEGSAEPKVYVFPDAGCC